MTTLTEFINAYSLPELTKEREKLQQTLNDNKRVIDEATTAYNETQFLLRIVDTALRLRESQGPPNGHKPEATSASPASTASVSSSPSLADDADKTQKALEIIRHGNGLRPGEIYRTMLAQGVDVRRPYISTLLMRFKNRDLVTVRDGKYFAKKKED